MYKVQKKNGNLENFDKTKITSGLVKAGTSIEDAKKVAIEIESWLPTVAVDNIVNSLDIRMKGLDVLKFINPEIAIKFENYQKSTE